jgi:hypothetical protein
MTVLLLLTSASTVPTLAGVPTFVWESILDLIGVAAAIWAVWALAWLDMQGALRRAFRLIAFGGLIFALLHVQDSVLRLGKFLAGGWVGLIHLGSVLVAMAFFVFGLARLADSVTRWQASAGDSSSSAWWSLAVGVSLSLGALSFIVYGGSPSALLWASLGLDAGLVLLAVICVIQVLRARLAGALGSALWMGLVALLIFSLDHPFQMWLSSARIVAPAVSPVLHRVVVIPAFIFFSISIARLSRTLAPQFQQHPSEQIPVARPATGQSRA